MPFKPSVNGWPFSAPEGPSPEVLGLGHVRGGPATPARLAGGMCWAALDRYLTGVGIPGDLEAPEPDSPFHRELVRRQVAALDGVWPVVRAWHGRPESSWRARLPVAVPGGRDLASLSRSAWSGIRKRLGAGEPVLLTLLPEAEPYGQPEAAIQVLACAYDRDGPRVSVSLYDPSRPGDDDVRLAFRAAGPFKAALTGGRTVRAFFAVPYDRARIKPLRAETFADRTVIGLNRKIRGRPSVVPVSGRLEMLARNGDGALLHFRRKGTEPWEGTNITDRQQLGGWELHSDPVAIDAFGGGLHVFARSYVGDLLHFRWYGPLGARLGWRVANRSDSRRAGPRFRLEGQPIPVQGHRLKGAIHVFGRGNDGILVQYTSTALRGWSAIDVPSAEGQRLAHDPVAVRHEGVLHVFGVTREGALLHFHYIDDAWHLTEPLNSLAAGHAIRFDGPPVVTCHGSDIHLFGRSPDGELVNVFVDNSGACDGGIVTRGIEGDPVSCSGPGGVHVFAPTGGGVAHAWNGPDWRVEEIFGSRSGLDPAYAPADDLIAWGSTEELELFGRANDSQANAMVTLRWAPDSDWRVHPVRHFQGIGKRHEPRECPVLVEDRGGSPHLFATDGKGSVVHVEPGEWREPVARPEDEGADRISRPVRPKPAPAKPKTRPEPVADETVAAEPVAAKPAADQATTKSADRPAAESGADGKPERPARPQPAKSGVDPLPLLEPEEPEDGGAKDEADPLPLLEMEPGDETGATAPAGAGEPDESDEAASAPEPRKPFSWDDVEPKHAREADDESSAKPDSDSEMEPIDLSTLDSWPPAPSSMTEKKERSRKKDTA